MLLRRLAVRVRPLHGGELVEDVRAVALKAEARADWVAAQDGADLGAAVGAARVCKHKRSGGVSARQALRRTQLSSGYAQ